MGMALSSLASPSGELCTCLLTQKPLREVRNSIMGHGTKNAIAIISTTKNPMATAPATATPA